MKNIFHTQGEIVAADVVLQQTVAEPPALEAEQNLAAVLEAEQNLVAGHDDSFASGTTADFENHDGELEVLKVHINKFILAKFTF